MKKVLILIPHYLPGYKSGGPQQTIMNICEIYKDKAEIYICTLNKDFGEEKVYDLPVGLWIKKYGIKIMYVESQNYTLRLFKKLYNIFDIIYSCGLFAINSYELMLLNRFCHKNKKKIYIAPMGVFSRGALMSKHIKKTVFIKVCDLLGLDKKIIWSFTSSKEKKDAERVFDKEINNYIIAEDIPRKPMNEDDFSRLRKEKGSLKLIFLSRISPKKNLLDALEILKSDIVGNVTFDIYGVLEDEDYWAKCKEKIKEIPSNIIVRYKGEVNSENVINIFKQYDAFLFPTKGENFGHVIYESLLGGCATIISDTTPWRGLERKGCGAINKLGDYSSFRAIIQRYIDMSPEKFCFIKMNAHRYAEEKYKSIIENSGYNQVFM